MGQLAGKIALITGASRGIGAAVAKRFASEGAHVILIARTTGALEEIDDEIQASGGSATLVPMDLRKFNKIDELGQVIAEKYGKLDILVGNAGILGSLGPVAHTDQSVWQKVLDVNLTANMRLIRSFDPLLRSAENGRAIFVSSDVAENTFPFWGAYAVSKLALEKLVKTYAVENKNNNIKANLVDPGTVATKMVAEAMPGVDQSELTKPEEVAQIFVDLAKDSCQISGQVVGL